MCMMVIRKLTDCVHFCVTVNFTDFVVTDDEADDTVDCADDTVDGTDDDCDCNAWTAVIFFFPLFFGGGYCDKILQICDTICS